MLEAEQPNAFWGHQVELWRERDGRHVGVRLRDGRIVLAAGFPELWTEHDGSLVVRQAVPESVRQALVGRRFRDLARHPVLPEDTVIAAVESIEPDHFKVWLENNARPIGVDELYA